MSFNKIRKLAAHGTTLNCHCRVVVYSHRLWHDNKLLLSEVRGLHDEVCKLVVDDPRKNNVTIPDMRIRSLV